MRGPFSRGGNGGGGATALAAGAPIAPNEGFALGANFYINPTASPINLPNPLDVAGALAAGFALKPLTALEKDENGNVIGEATVDVVKPTDASGSFIEITDSDGDKSSA